jgi:hypothetical protein
MTHVHTFSGRVLIKQFSQYIPRNKIFNLQIRYKLLQIGGSVKICLMKIFIRYV